MCYEPTRENQQFTRKDSGWYNGRTYTLHIREIHGKKKAILLSFYFAGCVLGRLQCAVRALVTVRRPGMVASFIFSVVAVDAVCCYLTT